MTFPGWLRTQWATIRAPADEAAPRAAPAPGKLSTPVGVPSNVHQPALDQINTTVRWLISALAASAAVMLAGVQLSSVGRLSYTADRGRLIVAGVAVAVAIFSVVLAIGVLSWVQAPVTSHQLQLEKAARRIDGAQADIERHRARKLRGRTRQLRDQVEADASMHRNLGSLSSLLSTLKEQRHLYYTANTKAYDAQLDLAEASSAEARAAAQAKYDRAADELRVIDGRLDEYRLAVFRVAHLDKYLRTRRRFNIALVGVLLISTVAAAAFVLFAWAANPPPRPSAAIAARPVAAQLVLTRTGVDRFTTLLGAGCTKAAATASGVPVIALATSTSGVEVVVAPGGKCSRSVRLTITGRDGEVVGAPAVPPG